jgi:ABC-2 type transport system permease protein
MAKSSTVVTEVLQLTGRNLRKITREPTLVFFSLAMPIIMLTLFCQVFKSIAQTPDLPTGVSYIDCLLPTILCTTLAQSATTSSTANAADLGSGMIDRFRSMRSGWPCSASASTAASSRPLPPCSSRCR